MEKRGKNGQWKRHKIERWMTKIEYTAGVDNNNVTIIAVQITSRKK